MAAATAAKTRLGKTRKGRESSSVGASDALPHWAEPTGVLDHEILFVDHPLFTMTGARRQLEAMKPDGLDEQDCPNEKANHKGGILLERFAKSRLLTPDEERYLFLWMNFQKFTAERLRHRLQRSPRNRVLRHELNAAVGEAVRTRNQIVQANLRLVVALARKACHSLDQLGELVSEGVLPLIRAVELFDISLGNRFSTYATWAVRNQIYRSLTRAHRAEELAAEWAERQAGIQEGGARCSLAETDDLSIPPTALNALLEVLTERERAVIAARFGLDGNPEGQSLTEVARVVGLCKERVRQIAISSLAKLQEEARRMGLNVEHEPR